MSNPAFRFARVSGQSIDWMLKRNCSVTPSQLGWAYGALCVTSLGIGAWFWAMGARFVLGFAWIELMAVGLAEQHLLHWMMLIICTVIFIAVFGVMFYSISSTASPRAPSRPTSTSRWRSRSSGPSCRSSS
jgi:hypothetical protein